MTQNRLSELAILSIENEMVPRTKLWWKLIILSMTAILTIVSLYTYLIYCLYRYYFTLFCNAHYIIMCKTDWRNHAETFRESYIIIAIIIIQIFLVHHVQRLFFIFIINTWLYCQSSLIALLRRCCVPCLYIYIYTHHVYSLYKHRMQQ